MRMTFGDAIEAMKKGSKVSRKGWGNKYVVMSSDKSSHYVMAEDKYCKKITTNKRYMLLRTVSGDYQPGWVPNQEDMISEDWEIISIKEIK